MRRLLEDVSRVNEVELIDRLRAGDTAARTTVVRRYHSALVHHASRILRDRGLAEDVVQDAWLAAFACIDGFDPRSSLFAWLVRIVINGAKGLRRREVRSLPFSAWATRTVGAAGDEELEVPGLTANNGSPERLLLEREALRRFNAALQALPESQRAVLLLRDFAGASPAEACRKLQISELAHRVRLCRARASIRQAL
jgi:RNA polymerase sigma-70 factor, ECF subfamily